MYTFSCERCGAWLDGGCHERMVPLMGLLSGEPIIARQIFRKLIDGRLKMTPRITSEGRFYDVQGRATYGRLLEGVISVVGLVPPERHTRQWMASLTARIEGVLAAKVF